MLTIKEKAKEKGVKMADIAAQLGISRQAFANSLSGKISFERIVDISRILDCSIYELFEPETGFGYIYDQADEKGNERFRGVIKKIGVFDSKGNFKGGIK